MRIFTSRYANPDLVNRPDLVKVRISIGGPRFKLGYNIDYTMPHLMPSGGMVKRVHLGLFSEDDYRRAYIDRLEIVGLAAIQRDFATIYGEQPGDIVLLCFEDLRRSGAWCHRTMAARWLETHGMGKVEELEEVSQAEKQLRAFPLFEALLEKKRARRSGQSD